MCNEYNGWANYPTWAVKLWIDNSQASQEYWRERAQAAVDMVKRGECEPVQHGYWQAERAPVFVLEDWLKSEYLEENPVGNDATVYADLMGWVLGGVDWRRIAESLLEDMAEV